MRRPLPGSPRNVLLIKSHSAGIGDLLRSSAAWAALKRRWPAARLHLVFLNRWPGYPSETLIREHFLLDSAHFLPMRESRVVGIRGVGPSVWRQLLPKIRSVAKDVMPELIIDFEPFGIETSIATFAARRGSRASTVGVAQVPGRASLYDHAGESLRKYAGRRGLPWPMDYTNRDFAALTALGIEREGTGIILRETAEGSLCRTHWARKLRPDLPVVGLSIGCGTPDARDKRPSIPVLVEALGRIAETCPHQLILTGAADERPVNAEFVRQYAIRWPYPTPIYNLGGECSLSALTGIIRLCHVFVASDSGPYHMAAALGTPTLALFNFPNPAHYHKMSNLVIQIAGDTVTTTENIRKLLTQCAPEGLR